MELRRDGMTTVNMVRQNLEKMRERAEALRKKTPPDELFKEMKQEFQASRESINEDFNRLEAECERTKPDPNNYDLQTPQGLQKLEEDEALWIEATGAVLTATRTCTDFIKDLVDQAVRMLSDIFTAMVHGETTYADKKVEEFMVWWADKFVKKANTAPQEVQDGFATASDEA
ncbi:unnamed protein product [Sphagnum jensenii]|jgi:hypothetical protein|uniref:Uncharacterized protein n=1 Tax=Sphagnum jensenii TaxID=128206 RepID=A0ABP0X8U5_9BRYO